MSTTGNADTTGKTFADQVNELYNSVETDDKGKLVFPEGTDEALKYAVRTEKQLRDTKAGYTKASQQLKVTEAEKQKLIELTKKGAKYDLTPEQKEELEDLKFSDPDAWRKKVNQLEREAAENHTTKVNEALSDVSKSTSQEFELEQRKQVLADFQASNPDFVINDDVIQNDIPPRITSKLNKGDISFEQYLQEAKDYLAKGKTVGGAEKAPNMPSLSKVGGDSNPAAEKNRLITVADVII